MAEPTQPLVCLECGRTWIGPVERWRVYLTDDDPRSRLRTAPSAPSGSSPSRTRCPGATTGSRSAQASLEESASSGRLDRWLLRQTLANAT